MFVMHDGELAGDDTPKGLCLQAIPSNGGSEHQNAGKLGRVQREAEHMKIEAANYSALFRSESRSGQTV